MARIGNGSGDVASQAAMQHNFLLDHVSPATRLLEKRRQMFEIQEALEAQKEEFARYYCACERVRLLWSMNKLHALLFS